MADPKPRQTQNLPTPRVIALNCPSCGGKCGIGASLTTFACAYCGANLAVERGEGTISLHVITETLTRIQSGTDRTAAELAISRLQKELYAAETQLESLTSEYNHALNQLGDTERLPLFTWCFLGLLLIFTIVFYTYYNIVPNFDMAIFVGCVSSFPFFLPLYLYLAHCNKQRAINKLTKDKICTSYSASKTDYESHIADLQRQLESARQSVRI